MSYVKTSSQPPGLGTDETAVTLDDGSVIAVSADVAPQTNGAPSVIKSTARAIHADGSPVVDAQAQPVTSVFTYTPTVVQANDQTQFAAVQKDCLMAVLGEPTTTIMTDPIHGAALANASIRNRIAALAIAGPVNSGALL